MTEQLNWTELRGVGWGGRWEGASKGRVCMYTYGRFILRFDRKQQNSVRQLSFNLKINCLKKHNEVLQYTCQNGYDEKDKKSQVLARMWRTGNLRALLVGMSTRSTMENSTEFPQKTKNRTTIWPNNSTLDIYPKQMKTLIHKGIISYMPYVYSSIIYNYYLYTHFIYISPYNWIRLSLENEWIFANCNMDGTWGHYAKWNKSDRKRQVLHDVTYMWTLKGGRKTSSQEQRKDLLPEAGVGRWTKWLKRESTGTNFQL